MRTDKGQLVRVTDQCNAVEKLFPAVGRNQKSVNKEEKVNSLGHEHQNLYDTWLKFGINNRLKEFKLQTVFVVVSEIRRR